MKTKIISILILKWSDSSNVMQKSLISAIQAMLKKDQSFIIDLVKEWCKMNPACVVTVDQHNDSFRIGEDLVQIFHELFMTTKNEALVHRIIQYCFDLAPQRDQIYCLKVLDLLSDLDVTLLADNTKSLFGILALEQDL